jgi:flagellin
MDVLPPFKEDKIMSNMVINTNVLALNSHRAMKGVGAQQAAASAKLSSGLRINSAADDAAGLAISEKMRAQIRGLDMASKNAQDGSSMVQTAEGGMQQIDNMVQRARELTVQAANDTNDAKDRGKIAQEMTNLFEEINSMSERVEFNGKKLINGDFAGTGSELYLQVGANVDQKIEFNVGSMSVASLGLSDLASDVKSAASATGGWTATGGEISSKLSALDSALSTITDNRSKLGAVQNRLDYTMKSLDISSENLSASESRIRDTDMAKEMMNLTKANVLSSAATSMLSQANQQPQNVLQLIR